MRTPRFFSLSMNRKEGRLLTPALSSTEEEREKRARRRFGGSMRECIRGSLSSPPSEERAGVRSSVGIDTAKL